MNTTKEYLAEALVIEKSKAFDKAVEAGSRDGVREARKELQGAYDALRDARLEANA